MTGAEMSDNSGEAGTSVYRWERWARVSRWSDWTSAEEVARRAAGRRRYNAARRRAADLRRLEVVACWMELGGARGSQIKLAQVFGVHRVTIARDLRTFWDRGRRSEASRGAAEVPFLRERRHPAAPPVPRRKRRASMSDRVSFRVEDALLERLRAVAQAHGVEVSELIRRAVTTYLDHGPTAPIPDPPPPAVVGPAGRVLPVWPPRADADEQR